MKIKDKYKKEYTYVSIILGLSIGALFIIPALILSLFYPIESVQGLAGIGVGIWFLTPFLWMAENS